MKRAKVVKLDWLSSFFGLNCGEIVSIEPGMRLDTEDLDYYHFIQGKCPVQERKINDWFIDNGFRFEDSRVLFSKKVEQRQPNLAEDLSIYRATERESEEIAKIAREVMSEHSRFLNFVGADKTGEFYATWVRNGITSSYDHICFYAKKSGIIAGFITLRYIDASLAVIGLIGVKEKFWRQGIAGSMTAFAENYLYAENFKTMEVVTEGKNSRAIDFYTGYGFNVISTENWYYKILNSDHEMRESPQMIPFNRPSITGNEVEYIHQTIKEAKLSGDGQFTQKCHEWFAKKLNCKKALLTPSCTHALEMAALLINIQPGDEVIMPSYTFVSTANAFALRGAKIVFVDIRPDTMNIDEKLIEAAITEKTKAIVPVHYAGVGCEMDTIMDIADRHGLFVIEDAAQGMMATYKGKPLGTIGHIGAYSFHETKNYTSGGEGGLLIVNDRRFTERAEIIREKGTDRSKFFRGIVDKYSWVDVGSSYLPSELQAAYLFAQLEMSDKINEKRLLIWQTYFDRLEALKHEGKIELPYIPKNCRHNAHMFYIKTSNMQERSKLIDHLKKSNILAVFHYVPLHSSEAGKKFGTFFGDDIYTTDTSRRLLRLPIFYDLTQEEVHRVCDAVEEFYKTR